MGEIEECSSSSSCRFDDREFHVVAVDDSVMNLKLVERLLRRCEVTIRVTTLESPQEALEYLNRNEEKVDMVISDYSMPSMTGYELLTEMKGCQALKDIPVVIMSSENVRTRVRNCMEHGAEGFILKPLNFSNLSLLTTLIKSYCHATDHGCSKSEGTVDRHHHANLAMSKV